ncbi:DNA polymerase lambda [Myotis davidii]|uniref:DNA polymerase lambda n=1 Tax=Myotis davidii TaxID=225400 RepID=L5M672_MYODS|nr:DNA polymerase lambda [Myotis davidii]
MAEKTVATLESGHHRKLDHISDSMPGFLDSLWQRGLLNDGLVSQDENGQQQKYLGVCQLPGPGLGYSWYGTDDWTIIVPYSEFACGLLYFTSSAHFNLLHAGSGQTKGMSLPSAQLWCGSPEVSRQLPPLRPPEGATGGGMASSFCKAWGLCSEGDPLCQDTALPGDLLRDTRLARAAGGALLPREADEPRQLVAAEMRRGRQGSHPPNVPNLSPPRRLPPPSLSLLPFAKLFPREQEEPLYGGSRKTSAMGKGPGEGVG